MYDTCCTFPGCTRYAGVLIHQPVHPVITVTYPSKLVYSMYLHKNELHKNELHIFLFLFLLDELLVVNVFQERYCNHNITTVYVYTLHEIHM